MDPLLSQAALLSGLADPAVRAAALAVLRPDELSGLAVELRRLQDALTEAAGLLRTTATTVAAAWSDPRPAAAALGLADAVDATCALVAGTADAGESAMTGIQVALDRAGIAVAAAERQLAGWSPDGSANGVFPGVAALRLPPPPDVVAAVVTLHGELEDAQRAIDAEAAALIAALTADPGEPLTALGVVAAVPGRGAVAPPAFAGSSGDIDRDLRARALADLRSDDPARTAFAAGALQALRLAAGGGPAALLVYEPGTLAGQGRVAIVEGDLASADNLAVLVPGVGNSPADMSGTVDLAHHLRMAAADQDGSAATAVVSWYGYDIPGSAARDAPAGRSDREAIDDLYAVLSADHAATGAGLLADDVHRFASMAPAGARITVVGHSMGSVVASEAAATSGLSADGLVLIGSPGAGPHVASVADYPDLDPGQVFVLADDADLITGGVVDTAAPIARFLLATNTPLGLDPGGSSFGPDPAAASFGATMIAAGSRPPTDDPLALPSTGALLGTDHHALAGYFSGPGLAAVAAVVTGRYSRVPTRPGRPR